ncbi:methionyl-tRNA synthetase [Rubritalea squalenifaciens DSM 18772]|uniref:methionine--tRNA ligase n=1 Tax=Rubritalea squalenifaciens DSM 18772 TaxID=1123071 RepID=A0A1M6HB09_9BACT|nr:class I tRNA ligase family protein [Rubritalea squalenifaciens]SHJ19336.1 methionyl-tRNA synthetase [Rubritalea squalenifaciens DSM 18772]
MKYYITTAIDYTNGSPHIGHAYEKVLADIITRYRRLRGDEAFFLTGVDQHGQKVQQTAEAEGVHPATYVRRTTKKFVKAWEALQVEYDDFAETTAEAHKKCVQEILQKLFDEGKIYKKAYKGHYSIRQEQFLTDKERNEDGEFGEEWGEVVELEEENYYFRLSDYVDWLREFVSNSEDFVIPAFRKADVLNAVERAVDTDLCISRPKERLQWGIEFPFDTNFVTYVWFDALINYISFAGYNKPEGSELPDFKDLWPAQIHIIGKDILVPSHSIYWPCMLKAMGFADEEMPRLLVHGWWNIKGGKMSKSLGNVVDPVELTERVGVDAVRYYLARDIHTGRDSDFDPDRLVMLFNTELANNLGNLCNRGLNMTKRYLGGECKESSYDDDLSKELREASSKTIADYKEAMDRFCISEALEHTIKFITLANVYAEKQKPWELAKDEANLEQVTAVLNHMVEVVAIAAVLLRPVIPHASERIIAQLQADHLNSISLEDLAWGLIPVGHTVAKPKPVFPRITLEEPEPSA